MRKLHIIPAALALAALTACGAPSIATPSPAPTCPPSCSQTGSSIVPVLKAAKAHKAKPVAMKAAKPVVHHRTAIVHQGGPLIDKHTAVKDKGVPAPPKMTDDEWCRSTGQGDHDVIIRYSHGVPVHTCK